MILLLQVCLCCHHGIFFNVNIPDVFELQGSKITYQGRRSQSKPITSHVDPRGRQVYWIGLSGEAVAEPKKA